ncbi:MAG: NAD-dependent dehydratase [Elusimicrobia bacterium GWC2_51_8]|nr:MAG: NAD-dependent dehydratase [Elusimicrobia bacterium GWA2_51_34]OGR60289.1 MAG: NAD-dependent dehydratase [Elusimicrobia bacterium GWC2_51_8]OGR85889.1 MAG: NAD-dependent dehydratase [Elusimicrobia bacterium GWF2_52_66]HAF96143.1 NAD-dependent dehydratase [Elusimicrobiota bacterium]HCE97753.1 NAD-dependent dehydratase [Elusimicrobiota bacterium]
MRILVTGAAGFLGSHLARYLISKGHSVVGIDNFITGNIENIEDLFGTAKFSFLKYDVTNHLYVPGKLDAVLHFASPASPIDYLKYPIPTLKVGALGTHKALGLAKEKNAVFMIASTSEVYGDPLINPQHEGYWGNVNPIGPRGVYDEAKRYAEALTMAYHRYHKMPVRILRIFNTYGPNMRLKDGRAVPNFMMQALKGKPITVYGDGSQTRSLCYVSDLVNGIYRLLMSGENDPVNIGNPHEISLLELAETIKRLAGGRSKIIFKPLPQDDPKVRRPDITRAIKLLKWQPRVALEEGLKKTIVYFKAKMK